MSVENQRGGQLVAVRRAGAPTTPAAGETEPAIPHGEFRDHDLASIASLGRAEEPLWWWLSLLAPRAGLMFLLWATRSPQHGRLAAIVLSVVGLVLLIAGVRP